jgi:putative FmdB family regulatory protein
MPIYEYRCEACGHHLETLQKITDPPLTDCHKCGKPALKKLISASAFRLKGGGWYETDFKTGGKKNVVEADKKDTAAGAPKGADTTSGSTAGAPKGGDTTSGAAASSPKGADTTSGGASRKETTGS